jgi:hypothetical protein
VTAAGRRCGHAFPIARSTLNEDGTITDDSNASTDAVVSSHQSKDHTIIVGGISMRIEDAFPTEAVKKYQDKPLPTHDKNSHVKPPMHLNQPRK